jgi:hypothetical protein
VDLRATVLSAAKQIYNSENRPETALIFLKTPSIVACMALSKVIDVAKGLNMSDTY